MSTILYIFVTSNRADQYLNPIIFTVENRNVKKVVFVEIIKQNGQQVKAEKILKNVYDFARHLTEGNYLKHKPQKSISLKDFYNFSELETIKSFFNAIASSHKLHLECVLHSGETPELRTRY